MSSPFFVSFISFTAAEILGLTGPLSLLVSTGLFLKYSQVSDLSQVILNNGLYSLEGILEFSAFCILGYFVYESLNILALVIAVVVVLSMLISV